MIDHDRYNEYRQRVIEKYTAAELVELLGISIEEILDAFVGYWEDNAFLLDEVGMTEEDEDAIRQ